jgi:hypothetical protein
MVTVEVKAGKFHEKETIRFDRKSFETSETST